MLFSIEIDAKPLFKRNVFCGMKREGINWIKMGYTKVWIYQMS